MSEEHSAPTTSVDKPARPESSATTATTTAAASAKSAQNAPLTAHATAIVADKATVTGQYEVAVHEGAIIHPYAKLDSSAGPIEIGEGCVIWERAHVGGATSDTDTDTDAAAATANPNDKETNSASQSFSSTSLKHKTTRLGPGVTVSAHAQVGHSTTIGPYTTIDVGARVSSGCQIGAWCKLSALTSLEAGTTLDDFKVVYFADDAQRVRVNVSARDFERVRAMEIKGRAKERETVGKALALAKAAVAGKGK